MLRILMISILLLLVVPAAHADRDQETLFNKVSLQADAQRDVPNDEMTVLLVAEQQGADASVLAERVNRDMAWALERAGEEAAVESETRGYSTQPMYRDGVIRGWRVRQELQLKSGNFTKMIDIVGDLQEKLQIAQMGFSPTPATRRQYQNELITEAMDAFKERVAIIQKSMGDRDFRIIELNINTDGFGHRPMMRSADMATASMERAAPAVEGGTSQVSVTVSGSVQFY